MKSSNRVAQRDLLVLTIGLLWTLSCSSASADTGESSASKSALRSKGGQPLVADNMMYFQTSLPNFIYAVNLQDVNHIVWKYTPAEGESAYECCDMTDSGLAYAAGKLVANARDGQLVALDAKTGKVLWRAKNSVSGSRANSNKAHTPLVAHGNVIVNVSGDADGARGYVAAYDLNSGKLRWRAYGMGSNEETLIDPAKTLNGLTQKPVGQNGKPGNCSVGESDLNVDPPWGWSSYDPRLNLLYYSTITPVLCVPPQATTENSLALTMFARNPDTGVALWERQLIPPGGGDYFDTNAHMLVDITVRGHRTPALVHFDGNGWTYVLDRRSGRLIGSHTSGSSTIWTTATSR